MDYSIHIDTISLEKSILYAKGLLVKIFYMMYSSPWRFFLS